MGVTEAQLPSVRVGRGLREGSGAVPVMLGVRLRAQAPDISDREMRGLGQGSLDGREAVVRFEVGEHASEEMKAQADSQHTSFPNRGSEQQVETRKGHVQNRAPPLTSSRITLTSCLPGRLGSGRGVGGGQ